LQSKHNLRDPPELVLCMCAIFFATYAAFALSIYGFALWFIQPPSVDRFIEPPARMETIPMASVELESIHVETVALSVSEAPEHDRIYTILVAGEDIGGLTDVIMLVSFNVTERTINVLSIPRDTMVNVPWAGRRINSIRNLYRRLPQDFDHYIYALTDHVERIVGFPVDHWITVDLGSFITLVNAIPGDGIYFNVPQRMSYRDPYQGLTIDLQPGYQYLCGYQAMQLVRYRRYRTGDIQRNQVQQNFLRALSGQLLENPSILIVDDLIRIFRDNVDTSLTLRNLAFFAMEFLRMESEDIRFHVVDSSVANIADNVGGRSMVTLHVDPWITLINTYMNPLPWNIYAEDVELLTRHPDTGALFTTNGAPF